MQIAIIGTTASGKSDLAIELARERDAIILSLDSLCLYKEINIASAKPSANELNLVKHFGIDLVYPNEYFSVGEFIKEYDRAREYALTHNKLLIITGGSGFYLNAMLKGLAPKVENVEITLSDDEIWEEVCKFDAQYANKFSRNDKFRLHKWYQIYHSTKKIPSEFLKNNTSEPIINDIPIFEIVVDKEILNKKIAIRTNKMIELGLIEEARYLFAKYGTKHKALNCIGLKETLEYLNNTISMDKLIELINIHTSQLAKRQRTFNKSQFNMHKTTASMEDLKQYINLFLNSYY